MNLSLHGDRHCVERNGGVVFRRLALLAKLFYITILGTACEPVPLAVEESAKSPPRLEARVESATDSSRYIVVLREESRQRVGVLDEMTRDIENRVHHRFNGTFLGFAASMTVVEVEALRRKPLVASVRSDHPVYQDDIDFNAG